MYNRVLVPIDGSETSVRALHEAIRVGQCQKAAAIHLLYVVDTITNIPQSESPPSYIKEIYAQARKYGQEVLEKARQEVERAGLQVETRLVELKRASDRISQVIIDEAKSMPAELLVMGTHGRRGLNHLLLGSVAESVTRQTPCPLLLVRSG
ncbi:MAG: universal stress protein [Gammaproteobacteria bacterium]|nr:universal stress protein [Gammaproteobacteria bacterium]